MRSRFFKRLARLGTGAFVLLVFQLVCAPGFAWADCNHWFVSRTDPGRLPLLVEPWMDELAGRTTEPFQIPPRPCNGAWCSGQPATPAVPAETFDWGMESWAWWACEQAPLATASSFTLPLNILLHPLHRGNAVFRPPQLLPAV
jgi:hypothetical protein